MIVLIIMKIKIFLLLFIAIIVNKIIKPFNKQKLLYTPKTLIVNLNHGKGIEFNINIIFEEYLNLRNYIFFRDSPF